MVKVAALWRTSNRSMILCLNSGDTQGDECIIRLRGCEMVFIYYLSFSQVQNILSVFVSISIIFENRTNEQTLFGVSDCLFIC